MIKNSDKASIREVYTIAQRLEEKIDFLDKRMSKMEGKASIIAIVWSSTISIIGIFVGSSFLKR